MRCREDVSYDANPVGVFVCVGVSVTLYPLNRLVVFHHTVELQWLEH